MKASQIELRSPYPPAECAARLSAAIELERSAFFSLAGMLGGKPILGRVMDASIYLRKRIGYRNVFQFLFTGSMRPEGAGTLITGDFAMHPFGSGCLIALFGIVILVGSITLMAAVAGFSLVPSRVATRCGREQAYLPSWVSPSRCW